jgi:hypothetical protein
MISTIDSQEALVLDNFLKALNGQNDLDFKSSETIRGISKIATDAEIVTGTNDDKIVTPKKLKTAISASAAGRRFYSAQFSITDSTVTPGTVLRNDLVEDLTLTFDTDHFVGTFGGTAKIEGFILPTTVAVKMATTATSFPVVVHKQLVDVTDKIILLELDALGSAVTATIDISFEIVSL